MAAVRFVRPGLAVVLVWLAVVAGAEVRLATCVADARLCPEATGLVHPHAPADGTHDDFSGGVSVGDFNRDGWQDLFVVTGGEGPDRLYLNRGDGTFREAAERAGVAAVHRGHGSVVGDIDRDGWLDIFVTSFGPAEGGPAMAGHHLLWLNLGGRRGGVLADGTPLFRNIALPALAATTSPQEPSGMGAALGDYDRDGDLDLAVVAWRREAAGSVLLNNQGIDEWTGLPRFLNATKRAGLFDTDMHGFTPHIVDVDGDRWPELLVAADFGTSRLYRNNGDGTFADVTAEAHVGWTPTAWAACSPTSTTTACSTGTSPPSGPPRRSRTRPTMATTCTATWARSSSTRVPRRPARWPAAAGAGAWRRPTWTTTASWT